jgi:hypothetical protein
MTPDRGSRSRLTSRDPEPDEVLGEQSPDFERAHRPLAEVGALSARKELRDAPQAPPTCASPGSSTQRREPRHRVPMNPPAHDLCSGCSSASRRRTVVGCVSALHSCCARESCWGWLSTWSSIARSGLTSPRICAPKHRHGAHGDDSYDALRQPWCTAAADLPSPTSTVNSGMCSPACHGCTREEPSALAVHAGICAGGPPATAVPTAIHQTNNYRTKGFVSP